jgi:hypothetical protein
MLRKRGDAIEWLTVSGSLPVCLEFLTVERGPFPNEAKRTVGQRPAQELERLDCDRRVATGVQGMEVRDTMLGVVHRDRDSVELADPRHTVIVPGKADASRPEFEIAATRC